jgi:hypothetical protein
VVEHDVALLYRISAAQEIFGRHALQHHGRRLLVADAVRNATSRSAGTTRSVL